MAEQLPPPTGSPVEPAKSAERTPKVIVWAFILSLFGFLVLTAFAAIAMTITGWKQVKSTGKGKGLAIASLIISGFWIVLLVFTFANPSDDAPQTSTEETVEIVEDDTVTEQPEAETITDDSSIVNRAQLGEEWPFTLDEGVIRCEVIKTEGIEDQPAAVITLDGNDYALNGVAISQGFTELTIDSDIWLDNEVTGAKVMLTPVTQRALALCDESMVEEPTDSAQQDSTPADISAIFGTLGITISDLPKRWNNAIQRQGMGILLPGNIQAQDTRFNIAEARITEGSNEIVIYWNPDNNEVSGIEVRGPNNPAENATKLAASAVAMVHATTKLTVPKSESLILNDLVGDALDNPDISAGLIIEDYEEEDRRYLFTLTGVDVTFSVDASAL